MPLPRTEFIAFIDESGDHGLDVIDPKFPVFATCAFTTTVEKYVTTAVPNMQRVKYSFFGNECVVFHGHKIRKKSGEFRILKDADVSDEFMQALVYCFERLDGTLIAAAIHKQHHKEQYIKPEDPFFLSLQFLLERLYMHWGQRPLCCVFEKRGGSDDDRTKSWFNDICGGRNFRGQKFPFTSDFQTKEANVVGHQYADLAAYTVARFAEARDETRKDWLAVHGKLRKSALGEIHGYGLKIFP